MVVSAFVTWLIPGAVGPAGVALPVDWAAEELAGAAQRWVKRLRRTDDLSRLVRAATGTAVSLTNDEFDAVRRLLKNQQTWTQLGHGTVDKLADQIACCLPPRDGRTEDDSHTAAMTIARGLLEFAVYDLDPEVFQKVQVARLQRMADQASALDKAMLDLHADLTAGFADQHADLTAGFADVMGQLKQVLNRLPPPEPAQQSEIVVYLTTLIAWLNRDPWPEDRQLKGPALTPADIERKLRITATGRAGKVDLDADDLARQCHRLVILGGPGSGKTWLAKRIARCCAEEALQALTAGGTLDEVELPLFTTCSRLFSADGSIREAAVSSALDHIGDMGGPRLTSAIHDFFTQRSKVVTASEDEPTLLVIDSLDEANGPDDRLREADTLPWRIVLTSRPSQWNRQLAIDEGNDSHRVGELQPLRYPDDVNSFIRGWFKKDPEWGSNLAAQIASRPGLQQAATVPLILAFYCIIGGRESGAAGPGDPSQVSGMPDFRHELYTKVLTRILRGYWHGSRVGNKSELDVRTCLQTLQAWAWSGACGAGNNHPVSGVGMWADEVRTERCELGEAYEQALNDVALPLGPPDIDAEETTLRRFVHRSIREHLVAEHVASLPVAQAVEVLLPHLWYDLDWEYAAPAALAMHPQRDQILRDLVCRAASSDQIPDLSVIDARWQFRGLLAQVAAESSEADWSPEVAGMIGQARMELAMSGRFGDVGGATHWGTSDRRVRDALLALLAGETDRWVAAWLALRLVQLATTAEDKRQARDALLTLLAGETDGSVPAWLAGGVAAGLAGGLAQLDPTAEDKRQARDALLTVLAREIDGSVAAGLAGGLAQLDPTAEDKRQARDALLTLLARAPFDSVAERLVGGLVQLATTAEDKRQARDALLTLLAGQIDAWAAAGLVGGLVQLDPVAEDKRRACDALLTLLAGQIDAWAAAGLVGGLAQLDPVAEDKRRACDALLTLLAGQIDAWAAAGLVGGLAQLDPVAEDKRRACDALLTLLAGQIDAWAAAGLVGGLAQLDPVAEDKRRACDALLGLLAGETSSPEAEQLAGLLVQLDPVAEDKRRACDALLTLLAGQIDAWAAAGLVGGLAQLDPVAEDKRRACDALLGLLAGETSSPEAEQLAGLLVQLDPVAEDKRRACDALLTLLVRETDSREALGLAGLLVQLDPAAEDKRRARDALLTLLAGQTDGDVAEQLARGLAQLDPTVHDLRTWRAWAVGPTAELLAAVRRNSALTDWLAALPSLTSLSRCAVLLMGRDLGLAQRWLELALHSGDNTIVPLAQASLGGLLADLGEEPGHARELLQAAIDSGEPQAALLAQVYLGSMLVDLGEEPGHARELLQAAIDSGNPRVVLLAQVYLGSMLVDLGEEPGHARELLQAAIDSGEPRVVLLAQVYLGSMLVDLGEEPGHARELLQAAIDSGEPRVVLLAQVYLGSMLVDLGEEPGHARELLQAAIDSGEPRVVLLAQVYLGSMLVDLGEEPGHARELLQAAIDSGSRGWSCWRRCTSARCWWI